MTATDELMADETITQFYTHDHDRLDALWAAFREFKGREPERAMDALRQFRSGLEQHMAWEESILFSEYDSHFGPQDETTTQELLSDHAEILNVLDSIDEKIDRRDWDTDKEEARLARTLAAHNRNEESTLYLKLDQVLSVPERAKIFQTMKEGAWEARKESHPQGGHSENH
jgi:regulator of cell morphogenesis and NO signaling